MWLVLECKLVTYMQLHIMLAVVLTNVWVRIEHEIMTKVFRC